MSDVAEAPRLGPRVGGLLTASTLSAAGDGMAFVALPLLAAGITHDALAIGGVLAASRLPWLLFALPLGAFADRSDRRRLAVAVALTQALVLGIVAVALALTTATLALIYGTAFVMGTLEAAFGGATAAVVPAIVARRELARANGGLLAGREVGERLVGAPAGAAAVVASAALPFGIDAASFVISAAILVRVLPSLAAVTPGPDGPRTGGWAIGRDVVDGVRYLLARPLLRTLIGVVGALAFFEAMVLALLVPYTLTVLHVSRRGYGVLIACGAVGGVVAAGFGGRINRRFGHARVLVAAALVAGGTYVLLAAVRVGVVAGAALAGEGFAILLGNSAATALRQEEVPADYLGRIGNAYRTIVYGAVPLGALAGGLLADAVSTRAAIFTAGVFQLAIIGAASRRVVRQLTP
ncbi:MAG: MFS transporter [Acidimicrobiales bacterium]